jgi:ArsR family transcriptional regulator
MPTAYIVRYGYPAHVRFAVADATRRRILALLVKQGELCVCELTAALDDIQPKVSRHLGVLKEAGVVLSRREGTWMFYRLEPSLPVMGGDSAGRLCPRVPYS